jgi:hypothetical protein
MSRIHWIKMLELMTKKDEKGKSADFSIDFVKKSTGEIVSLNNCSCTSIHAKGSTINIKSEHEVRPKTIRKCLIINYNGMEVYL